MNKKNELNEVNLTTDVQTKKVVDFSPVPFYFYEELPVALLLLKRQGLSKLVAAYAIVLMLDIPILVLALSGDLWFLSGPRVGLLEDFGVLATQLIGVPATFYMLLWIPGGIQDVLSGLSRNKVILAPESSDDDEPDQFTAYVESFRASVSNPIWAVLSVIIMLMFVILIFVPTARTFDTWTTADDAIFWYMVFFWFVVFSAAGLLIIRALLAISWFNRLFRDFEIDIRVLHPDGAGGLSPLGGFSVKVGYLIGIYGFMGVVTSFSDAYLTTGHLGTPIFTPGFIVLVVAYLILAPVAFFAPIGAARSSMKEAKNDFVMQISDQFELEASNVRLLIGRDVEESNKAIEQLEQLQRLHNMVSGFPVWPFNTTNLVRFLSAILTPLLIAIIPALIELLFN